VVEERMCDRTSASEASARADSSKIWVVILIVSVLYYIKDTLCIVLSPPKLPIYVLANSCHLS